jgi:hypothetical protein
MNVGGYRGSLLTLRRSRLAIPATIKSKIAQTIKFKAYAIAITVIIISRITAMAPIRRFFLCIFA